MQATNQANPILFNIHCRPYKIKIETMRKL